MFSGGHRANTQATHLQLFPESSLLLCQLLLIISLLLWAWEVQFLVGKQMDEQIPSNGRAPRKPPVAQDRSTTRPGYPGSYGGHPVG